MADTNDSAGDVADSKGKASDAIFMMECLKHLQTPATIDVSAVAKALKYKNPMSVANRIREIRKQFNLQQHLTCSANSANGGTATPRKGAKASTGPIKAKVEIPEEGTEGAKAEKAKPGRKPGAKRGRKPKIAAAEDNAIKHTASNDNNEAIGAATEDTA
ncbi:conserved hypothetical protein [Histoplasma capsulatum G186AR]|uniref:Uncharacterized protein n=2 Tax=Ajellomyces capsulatus TaxID=5037 RepID=C0P054_AJECG|nr:uncharacterized protein HCBG_08773 [Histoplasma capsulatum G186AR]EEH02870.1 conserved hypothetical protein [Histoplasma capsulatum G186AR]KAG5295943.1 hypothetical protein I7I52_06394 [Histoplasma capsulatum]QSS73926.1 hypothetical protein I7I50_08878 [Histoplasma capsulatum G186AR]